MRSEPLTKPYKEESEVVSITTQLKMHTADGKSNNRKCAQGDCPRVHTLSLHYLILAVNLEGFWRLSQISTIQMIVLVT